MKKKKYQRPQIDVVQVECSNIICTSPQTGKIEDWKLDNDDSGSDDWGSDESRSKGNSLWGGFED
ncbi:hypothetical protein [Prevotella sp. HUN102]|uniref:hypothetical protein n=1 Tax=Prevotella sp. HUN102 TaxID=1392486 RepID=UPI00048C4D31|nr:hypothetical protein [Prevotella sp. HUN102]